MFGFKFKMVGVWFFRRDYQVWGIEAISNNNQGVQHDKKTRSGQLDASWGQCFLLWFLRIHSLLDWRWWRFYRHLEKKKHGMGARKTNERPQVCLTLESILNIRLGINSVSIHPSGKLALSCSRDRTMRLWNLVNGRAAFDQKLSYGKHLACAF